MYTLVKLGSQDNPFSFNPIAYGSKELCERVMKEDFWSTLRLYVSAPEDFAIPFTIQTHNLQVMATETQAKIISKDRILAWEIAEPTDSGRGIIAGLFATLVCVEAKEGIYLLKAHADKTEKDIQEALKQCCAGYDSFEDLFLYAPTSRFAEFGLTVLLPDDEYKENLHQAGYRTLDDFLFTKRLTINI